MNSETTTTSHSESGPLTEVYLKSIAEGFVSQTVVDDQWKALNYLDRPDYKTALAEYAAFVNILRQSGCTIRFFDRNDDVGMDSIYCRDACIVTDQGIILCNMGKPLRSAEPAAQRAIFEANGLPILGEIEAPGTIEGGDVAWLDRNTLAVGHGYRTNSEGIAQLKSIVEPLGVEVIEVFLPHYKGPDDVFHLMSIFSPVDEDLAVVYSPLMPVIFRNELRSRGYRLVEVPESEFESMGCNVLALSPRNAVIVEGNQITENRLIAAGCTVHTYRGKNISILGGGGPTCLTRPVARSLKKSAS